MYRRALKYVGEQDEEVHGGPVTYPVTGGFPIKGKPPSTLTRRDLGRNLTCDAKAEVFCTWVPEQLQAYTRVMDRVANRTWLLMHPPEKVYVPEEGGWRILLTWVQIYDQPRPRDV